jgi:O-acetyl-ADP-ribose deacetylase (regulator of RNase III)
MTMERTAGDIFKQQGAVLVNPVNTVGVMGKGLALAMKIRFPAMFEAYVLACGVGECKVGRVWLWQGAAAKVLCFPTKAHWREPSTLAIIEAGLQDFAARHAELGIAAAAFPQLGCGAGGLSWADVEPLMRRYLEPLPVRCVVVDPGKERSQAGILARRMER